MVWFFLAEAYFSADTGALVAFSRMWLKNDSEISFFFFLVPPSVVVAQSDYCTCQPRALGEVMMKRGFLKNLTKPINDNHCFGRKVSPKPLFLQIFFKIVHKKILQKKNIEQIDTV